MHHSVSLTILNLAAIKMIFYYLVFLGDFMVLNCIYGIVVILNAIGAQT